MTASINKIEFKGILVGMGDKLVVPENYTAIPLAPWGEPFGIAGRMPASKMDSSKTADDQAVQLGMHHNGLEFFPLQGSNHGLLAINHEYTDDGLLHVGGFNQMNPEKVRKAQNAHGLAVIEIEMKNGRWDMVRPAQLIWCDKASGRITITWALSRNCLTWRPNHVGRQPVIQPCRLIAR